MRFLSFSLVLITLICTLACSTTQEFKTQSRDRRLLKAVESNPIFTKYHAGFALYDPERKEWLCQYNADRYFTPASNTKILTLLTSLHVLGDSIETLRYTIKGDSLFFHGMGDPSFLFSEIPTSSRPMELLRQHPGILVYQAREEIDHYGPGWAWDDYPYTDQIEKSVFPVYGNRVRIYRDMFGDLHVVPEYFSDYIEIDTASDIVLSRDPVANAFVANDLMMYTRDTFAIPFVVSDYEVTRILSKALGRSVGLFYDKDDSGMAGFTPVYGVHRDTLLKIMMQDSDNFISEQLLMQCAFYMRDTWESDSAIAVAQQMIMGGTPDSLFWVDGSGLSRYNLITPRSIVWVLEQLQRLQSMDYLTAIFPAGGRSGTIAEWYGADPPFVFAKTGSLRNQHCLSGYLYSDSGKWLIFSFMHNNFTGESAEIKKEMEKILLKIKERW